LTRKLFQIISAFILTLAIGAVSAPHAAAQNSSNIPASITTPNKVDSTLGTLQFNDGTPDEATIQKVYDNIDFTHALEVFMNTFQGASMEAVLEGQRAAGVNVNEILIFSKLMDSKSLFLTANADTVYFVSFIDLSKGPMVFEAPPGALGVFDDMWWRWVSDFGVPGPDRGMGGKYLLLPPDYDGPLPEGGYFVARCRTTRVGMLGRMFMVNNDPKPTADLIKAKTRIYPYQSGAYGTSIAEFLAGKAKLAQPSEPAAPTFHEGSGVAMNTVPPNDWTFYEMLNRLVQDEPATVLDPELMGPLAAVGIVKGKPFSPDERMKKIMNQALAVGNATSRTFMMNPRERTTEGWAYYPDSAWLNPLFVTGYQFETPIPMVTPEGVKPFPPTGYRTLNARSMFFYGVTGITPAMSMRVPGIGSQYLWATLDANKKYFDGSKTYKVVLPKGIPQAKFWSLTLYDNQTRSMLETPQRYPRAGSQTYPSPAAEADSDGSTTVYFSPTQPAGVKRGNWIQTTPDKGWFIILRLYSPLEPFFDKSWRPSEISEVK